MNETKRKPFLPDLFTLPEGGTEATLVGARCGDCGLTMFPIRPWCPRCFGKALNRQSLSRRGRLYTFTICRMPLPHLKAPYAIGWVELPEGVRVFALLVEWKETDLSIGRDMQLTAGRLRIDEADGSETWCYQFKPA